MKLATRRLFVAILFIAIFVMATREISDPDFWWHLRTGQFILETNSIPHIDIYSHTNLGRVWVTHEWLSEAFIYSLYRLGSFPALILTFAVIIALSFAFVYIRSGGKPFVAALAVLLAAVATAPTWGVRPQMLSMLMTSLFLWILDSRDWKLETESPFGIGNWKLEAGSWRLIWLLVPLMLLWVNLHSGFALGIAIVGAYLIGEGLTQVADRRSPIAARSSAPLLPRSPAPLFLVFLACLLVVPLNPNGATMYVYPLETLGSRAMQTYIQEWFSPDFHLVEFQPFALLLLATFASLALSRKITLTQILLLVIFGYAGLRSARHIPIFALIAAPVLAANVWDWMETRGWSRFFEFNSLDIPKSAAFLNWSLLSIIAAAGILRIGYVVSNQTSVERAKYPAAAIDFLQSQPKADELFNSYSWGGYLIWRLYPQSKVFIDGRADVYGDLFIEQFLRAYHANSDWRAILDRHGIGTILVEPDAPIAMRLAESGDWKKVFSDGQAVIYRK